VKQVKINNKIAAKKGASIDIFTTQIRRAPALSPEQELSLALLAQSGDKRAFDKLIECNLRFVLSVAKQYQDLGVELEDLIGAGCEGIMEAGRHFSPQKGVKFISYAVWWIQAKINQTIEQQARIVRLPMNRVQLIGKIKKKGELLEQLLQREVLPEEIAEALNISVDKVLANIPGTGAYVSINGAGAGSLEDDLSEIELTISSMLSSPMDLMPDYSIDTEALRKEINRHLAELPQREADVMVLFFGLNDTPPEPLEKIAEILSTHKHNVVLLRNKALSRLRKQSTIEALLSL
jgi:RNA polymerase primary sigma factor